MSLPLSPTTATQDESDADVVYPESDGRPLGETGFHVEALVWLHQALKRHLAGRSDAYVASNMFLYYERGNPRGNRSPDVMVILGVDNHTRRTFKTWVENAVPTVIFEISSDETYREDVDAKRVLYARLGVAEYFLFDPLGDCLDPRLQGHRLEAGASAYVPIVPDRDGRLESRALGLRLAAEEGMLRLFNARTNAPILTEEEVVEGMERERDRAEREKERAEFERHRANSEILRAESERLRAESERLRAESESLRAGKAQKQSERSKRKAEQEKQRADALAAEVARLRALLGEGE